VGQIVSCFTYYISAENLDCVICYASLLLSLSKMTRFIEFRRYFCKYKDVHLHKLFVGPGFKVTIIRS